MSSIVRYVIYQVTINTKLQIWVVTWPWRKISLLCAHYFYLEIWWKYHTLDNHTCIPISFFGFQSAVMSATFAKFHPNLIIGGTYSGQIVLWDNRSSKRTPVQRTPLSATAHTVSIGYMHVTGSSYAF
jgi:hypothetical protein